MLEDRTEREDSVETVTSLNTEDSCSTVSSMGSGNHPEHLELAAPRDGSRQCSLGSVHAPVLRVYRVQAVHADGAAPHTVSFVSLTLQWGLTHRSAPPQTFAGCGLDPSLGALPSPSREGVARLIFPLSEVEAHNTDRRRAVVLVINRNLISKCALFPHQQQKPGNQDGRDVSGTAKDSSLRSMEPADLAYLPREGIELTLYFTSGEKLNHRNLNASPDTTAQRYLCRSYDVVNLTTDGGASLYGVPLKPYHRYHLKYTNGRGIVLNLNKYSFLHLYANSEESLSERGSHSADTRHGAALKEGKRGAKRPRKIRTLGPSGPFLCAVATKEGAGVQHRPPRKRVTAPRKGLPHADLSSIDSFPSFTLDSDKSDAAAAPLLRRKKVIFTTGMRLSQAQERLCVKLGFVVNPSLSKAREASVLIVKGPLMRSVKLLTVLPYVKALVDRKWFDDMLAQGNPLLPIEPYTYSENKREGGIECTNGFCIENTLSIPSEQRQRLFTCHVFWIHPSAVPQEPPINDLHTVLTASGGKISKRITEATTWVLPSRTPSVISMRLVTRALNDEAVCSGRHFVRSRTASDDDEAFSRLLSSDACVVVPDDIFRSILQQRDLSNFTLQISKVASALLVANSEKRICASKQRGSTEMSKNIYPGTVYISMRIITNQRLGCNMVTIQRRWYFRVSSLRMMPTPGKGGLANFILDALAPALQKEFDVKANQEVLRHLIRRGGYAAQGSAALDKVVEIRVSNEWMHCVSWRCTCCGAVWVARPVDRVNPQTRESASCPSCRAAGRSHHRKDPAMVSSPGSDIQKSPEKDEKGLRVGSQAEPLSLPPTSLLVEQYPMVASQWDTERNALWQNGVLQPLQHVRTSSAMVVWFKCPLCARSWRESVSSRVARYEDLLKRTQGSTRGELFPLCPSCEQRGAERRFQNNRPSAPSKVANKNNSLSVNITPKRFLSQDLLLMQEVCLRPDQDPNAISLNSEQVLSWACRYCGYRYQSSLKNRVRCHEGCPQCNGKVCTPMNSLVIQRPDVVKEVTKSISRTKLMKLTVISEQEIPFVCRTCFSPYRMTAKARCMIPKGGVACQKCFLNFSQTAQDSASCASNPRKLTARERRKLRQKAYHMCLSGRSIEKLEATCNDIVKRDRVLIN